MATSKTRIANTPMPNGTVIEFVKKQVIGEVIYNEFGDKDILSEFFKCVEYNSRDAMNPDSTTIEHFEMTDNLGTTKITVEHTPLPLKPR